MPRLIVCLERSVIKKFIYHLTWSAFSDEEPAVEMRRRMRIKLCYLLAVVTTLMFSQANAQQTAKATSTGIKYLEYLPDGYNSNLNKYPVVISLHGIGERGTDVNKVANVSLAKYIKYGQKYPFIVISPQLTTAYGTWPADYVMQVVNYVKSKLRIDDRRVYLTGLSLGGYGVWKTVGAYPSVFAAIVPICSGGSALSQACAIAAENVPIWAFHGDADHTVSYTVTTKMVNAVNACTPKPSPLAKVTIFPGLGHAIWDKVYKETNALTWMTSFVNGSTSTTEPTTWTVSAGSDKSLTLPTNSIAIQGSVSGTTASSYLWTKISGGTASMSGTTSSKLTAYNLVAGTYYFRLTVKDSKGVSKSDDVKVTVSSSTNKLPIVSAGSDKTITQNYLTLVGSASDPDGYIASYQWTKVSGPSCSMSNTTTSKLFTSKLASGTYYFRLTAKDNKGAAKYDDVKLVVNYSTASISGGGSTGTSLANVAPAVNAGYDKSITLPRNYITLVGSVYDKDGSISSIRWTKLSGGSLGMYNYTTSKLFTNHLVAGIYSFRLTAKDNDGAVRYDDVRVTVKNSTASLIMKVPSNRIEMVQAFASKDNENLPSRLLNDKRGLVTNVLNVRKRMSAADSDVVA
jgi:hypothetical protein